MEANPELAHCAFSEMVKSPNVGNQELINALQAQFPACTAQVCTASVQAARDLHALVRRNPFIQEPLAGLDEKVKKAIRESAPGLAEHTYFYAYNQIMRDVVL
jgi:hypothetical protein